MQSIDDMFDVASQHYRSGNMQLAVETYEQILQGHPNHPRALHALGVIAFQNGDGEAALEFINSALTVKNDYADAHNSKGNILMHRGLIREAVASYRLALSIQPGSTVTLSNLGNALIRAGEVDEAIIILWRAADADPGSADIFLRLGNLLRETGKLEDAIDCYRKALSIRQNIFPALVGQGMAHRDLGRLEDAMMSFEKATEIMPSSAEAHFLLATVLEGIGKYEDAVSIYQMAINLKPDFADALNNLGNIIAAQGNTEEARKLFSKALESRPHFFHARNNLGNVLTEMGHYEEAIENYRKAIEINPNYAEAYSNLGNVLSIMDRDEEALSACRKAVELDPDSADSLKNLGNALASLALIDEAMAAYQRALALLSSDREKDILPLAADIHYGLANALRDKNRLEEAAEHYLHAVECKPGLAMAHNNLGNIRKDQGRLDEALESYRRGLEAAPLCSEMHSNLLFSMNYSDRFTVEDILAESLNWERFHGLPRSQMRRPFANSPKTDRKIKVGYVSADFGRHPVGFFLLPVLKSHDQDRFEIFCYSGRVREDDITRRLRTFADNWRSIVRTGDEELAELIRSDGIDILVDLSGHTAGNRLPVFAMKPAPVQATWAGYVGTTGLSTIDYLISDRLETPEGVDHLHVENIVRLPDDYICYEPPAYSPPVSPLPMLVRRYPTFGCFNNLNKISQRVIELWAKLLLHLSDARLLLVTGQLDDRSTRDLYNRMFSSFGVAERVELHGAIPHRELLRRYNDIDIALDPFPYSGGLTTLESLWMGVPVVTMAGDRFAGRHSLTHLTNVGVKGLVAESPEEYLDIAVSLANDPRRLADLRNGLRSLMESSPVCDGPRFTRNLERAYIEMWRSWCLGKEG